MYKFIFSGVNVPSIMIKEMRIEFPFCMDITIPIWQFGHQFLLSNVLKNCIFSHKDETVVTILYFDSDNSLYEISLNLIQVYTYTLLKGLNPYSHAPFRECLIKLGKYFFNNKPQKGE